MLFLYGNICDLLLNVEGYNLQMYIVGLDLLTIFIQEFSWLKMNSEILIQPWILSHILFIFNKPFQESIKQSRKG